MTHFSVSTYLFVVLWEAMIPLLILGAIAVALLLAAGYAIFGKPHSAVSKKRQRQIVSGFGLAGGVLLGALLVGCVVFGIGVAFFGMRSSSPFWSRPMGFFVALAAFCLIAFFVQRWAKYFAGWMSWSVLNGLMMVSSGHMVNNPSVPVPRSVALTMTGLMLITVIASLRFRAGYKLNTVDKSALLLWVLAFAIGANTERYMLIAITVGCAGLVLAWGYHAMRTVFCAPHTNIF